ncbi:MULTISPECIES: ABC transporter substrate-binding protein [unclassified Amycolatopsis]|uniref:ABC transporter substrate-binding protein n=1 Tax=unclassified Amycolatopsis TaxID=2618356 RepID=UPI001FF269E1|nr:ABC transporter substrate-binding protein [Amycolatopsis sp. FBCC-B4732]UOX92744.1 ABC transporter substrate-binding protein [Amycolatopsis sp. FBCC-B4732]
MTGGGSRAALVIGSAFMHDLGSLFPVTMSLAGDDLAFTFVSSCPSPDAVGEWVGLRSGAVVAGRVLHFFVDANGRRIRVELAGTAVRALIVLADEMTAATVHAPWLGRWQDQMPCLVQVAIDELARRLSRCRHRAGGADPLIDLQLAYRPDQQYEARLAGAHERVRGFIAPVRPVLAMRWRTATSAQRRAFLDELPDAVPARGWLRRKRTVRLMGLEVEVAQ